MYWVLLLIAIALTLANLVALGDRPWCLFALQFCFRQQRCTGLLERLKGQSPGPDATPARWSCAAAAGQTGPAAVATRPPWLTRYRRWLWRDYLTLLCYGAFGWFFAGVHVTSGPFPGWVIAVAPWLLPVAAAADALENALHLHLTGPRGETAPGWLYPLAGLASSVKFLLILAFMPLFSVALWLWVG